MPNWCNNILTVKGEEDEIKHFELTAKKDDQELSLEKLYPCPIPIEKESPETNIEKIANKLDYKAEDWYEWNTNNWGTKWDIKDATMDGNEYELIYTFDTAWSPPIKAIKNFSENFPSLVFILEYDEPGGGSKGLAKIKNGSVEDHCIEY
ncbi:MAG: hypothetical protein WC917_04795 [Bacilli bacterium]|jgi:hypothetical protein